jgi:hypothetical protein
MEITVLSTYKILKEKAFNSDISETWVDWAIEMIEAGYESENLYELAGISRPYNQFELHDLTSKVLKDLELDFSNKELTLRNYVYYIISNSINKPETYLKTLRELNTLCTELNFDKEYLDFYFLYFAKDDLIQYDSQSYWTGADKTNIDSIIKSTFENWNKKVDEERIQNAV